MQAHDSTFEIPPFPAFPSSSRYVSVGSLEDARQRISRSIDACEGLSLVIGPPGTGKSLLCAVLTRDYSDSHDVVNLGDTPIEDPPTFYRHLLHHLGVAFESIPKGDLQLALINRVRDKNATQQGMLVLIDEAQGMSPDVLEAIRMTTNIMLDGHPRVYAVVCGGPKLDDTLALPALEPLTQRVATRCYLHPLNSQETRQYISESIRHCGANPEDTISDEAIAAIHHACSGVPRLINQLVTCAIDVAAETEQDCISDAIVDRAWADLQQLPSPMLEEPCLTKNTSTVEFGQLDEGSPIEYSILEESPATDGASFEFGCETECGKAGSDCCESVDSFDETAAEDFDAVIDEDQPTFTETTPPQTVLFGDFDDEEELVLGNGIIPIANSIPEVPIDLESILHCEIIGIANDASDASRFEQASDAVRFEQESDAVRFEQESDAVPDGPSSDTRGFAQQSSVQWLDELEATDTTDDSDIVIHDDSDMLVIEDDVDLQAGDATSRIDCEEQTISVDFRAMLSRMRHGTAKEAS